MPVITGRTLGHVANKAAMGLYRRAKAVRGAVRGRALARKAIARRGVKIWQESTGYHGGQLDMRVHATRGKRDVGRLAYSEFRNGLHVNMVNVKPAYKRRGIARRMYQKMLSEFPKLKVQPAYLTNEGAKLRASMRKRYPKRFR